MYGINSPAFDFACGTRLTEYIRYKIREETAIKIEISNLILSRIDLVSTQFFKTAAEMNTQLNAIKGFMRNDRHKCKIENTSCYIDTRLKSSKKDSGSNNSRFSVYDKNAEVKYRISKGTAKPNEIIDDNVLRYEIQLRGTKLKEHFGRLKLDSFLTNPDLCVQAFLYGLSIFGLDNDIITADTLKTAKEHLINERIKGKKVQQRTLDKLTDYINKIEKGTLTYKESNSEYKAYLAQSGFSEKYAETFRQFNCPGYISSAEDETAEPEEIMYNSRYAGLAYHRNHQSLNLCNRDYRT
jgi:hypothetical protein